MLEHALSVLTSLSPKTPQEAREALQGFHPDIIAEAERLYFHPPAARRTR